MRAIVEHAQEEIPFFLNNVFDSSILAFVIVGLIFENVL